MKTFTIEEISEAWLEFNKPYYLVDGRRHITSEDIKQAEHGMIISGTDMKMLPPDYAQWIPFLIMWKKHKKKG